MLASSAAGHDYQSKTIRAAPMKIDIFNHFLPIAYLDTLDRYPGPHQAIVRYARRIRALWDVEQRIRMIEQWPDLVQVITLGQPTPELAGGPELSALSWDCANCQRWHGRNSRPMA